VLGWTTRRGEGGRLDHRDDEWKLWLWWKRSRDRMFSCRRRRWWKGAVGADERRRRKERKRVHRFDRATCERERSMESRRRDERRCRQGKRWDRVDRYTKKSRWSYGTRRNRVDGRSSKRERRKVWRTTWRGTGSLGRRSRRRSSFVVRGSSSVVVDGDSSLVVSWDPFGRSGRDGGGARVDADFSSLLLENARPDRLSRKWR